MALKPIAPGVTDQVPVSPPMWRGGPSASSSGMDPYGPPENWAMGPSPSANELQDVNEMVAPIGGGPERLGAKYSIDVMIPYHEPANWQPTRASEFYGWSTGR